MHQRLALGRLDGPALRRNTQSVVDQPQDVVVHTNRVGLQGCRQPAVLDQVGVANYSATKIAAGGPIYRVGVPDSANVDAVSH